MRLYFVFSCIYPVYCVVGHFRRSNKWWILFIYTHKHVLIVPGYSPIKGAKMRICFWLFPTLGWACREYWSSNGQKSGLLGSIIHIHANLLLICTKYNNVEWWWSRAELRIVWESLIFGECPNEVMFRVLWGNSHNTCLEIRKRIMSEVMTKHRMRPLHYNGLMHHFKDLWLVLLMH